MEEIKIYLLIALMSVIMASPHLMSRGTVSRWPSVVRRRAQSAAGKIDAGFASGPTLSV